MIVEQIYTGCLAQGAYYIESEGEALVIDPLREVEPYIKKAAKSGAQIKYVFETHFHADFVSGHIDLAAKTGAKIVFGPNATCGFGCYSAKDGEEFKVGKYTMRVLHTPGHTLESTCYLLLDENGRERYVFTGDTLFIGDVGRPDLAQKSDIKKEDLAAMLYDSLNTKIKTLPDDVIVYPAHGAGSACGKNLSKETFDTVGRQKQTNYALLASTKAQFIEDVLAGLTAPPAYFPMNVQMNKHGYPSIDSVLARGNRALDPITFELEAEANDALVLDTRPADEFSKGFIPNSINIGLGGQFAPWVGELITDIKQPILVVAPVGMEEEAIIRLSRVGYDATIGYLKGGFAAWQSEGKDVETIDRISAEVFAQNWLNDKKNNTNYPVLDIRREGEYAAEHVEDAFHRPLSILNDWMGLLDKNTPFTLYCGSGYRSMIAASILKARGFNNFKEVAGGFAAIAKTSVLRTDFVCQSKISI
ncbi:MAG: MBL fold metallo-hydrolase [Saprospiraceae bacterium]|nr:MBL fold metallo-hydrolase [Saprospiraceae bacterium]